VSTPSSSIGQVNESFPTVPTVPLWKLNVEQYHQMIQSGILTEDDPVELLHGLLVAKTPQNPRHRIVTRLTRDRLENSIPPGYYVDSQEPITLTDIDELEPDVVVIQGDSRDYRGQHPTGLNVALVVEVSDSTLKYDRTLKLSTYAQAGIPVYWIINLIDQQIEVYSAPTQVNDKTTYQTCQILKQAELVVIMIDDLEVEQVTAKDLLH
jgi:Uma2 family endonuclease